MFDYAQARQNMVDCQIRTSGVILPALVEALEVIPRERFVPEAYKSMAYNDGDIALGQGRYVLEPAVFARMVQALEPHKDDVALYVGGGTGYGAAILSFLVSTVVSVESENSYIDKAAATWAGLDLCNIVTVEGPLRNGNAQYAPYDCIFINGAVSHVPEHMLEQLSVNGRLVCVVKEAGAKVGHARLYRKSSNGTCSHQVLFDAATPYLAGFAPEAVFEF